MFHGVLDATQADCVGDVSGRAHYKQVAQTLIEQDLRGDATVRASENDYFRVLIFREAVAKYNQLPHLRLASYKSLVSLHQIGPNLVGRARLKICARMVLGLLSRSNS